MRINKLDLHNFRGIKEQVIELDGKTSVFFGINGTGKSTVLRGINILFSSVISKITQGRYKRVINIESEDIRFGEAKVDIKFELGLNSINDNLIYYRGMERRTKRRYHGKNALAKIANTFEELYLKDDSSNMPIFVNYGVHRVVLDIPLRINKNHSFDKLSAFEKAVENRIDFRSFFEWFRNQEDLENEIKANLNKDYIDVSLQSVRTSIYRMMNGFSELRVKRSPLRMTIIKDAITLEMEQLSDGEKCTMALIGDLARRLALANSKLLNPLLGEGIVLIDEIELHMHPTWQRKIIPTLRDIFPNIQFIITTHSPQVLGELDESVNVFSINQLNNTFVTEKITSLIAWDSNLILEELMGTASLNKGIKENITKIFELIQQKDFKTAAKLTDEIDHLSQGNNIDIVKAKILIARGIAK